MARGAPDPATYHLPVKRSLTIAGHKSSISLEPLFWDRLKRVAMREGVPVARLVERIDAARLDSPTPCGLAGAVRLWLMHDALTPGEGHLRLQAELDAD